MPCVNWTEKATKLHTEHLVNKFRLQPVCEEPDAGTALLLEIASSKLPPADSLWSSDDDER